MEKPFVFFGVSHITAIALSFAAPLVLAAIAHWRGLRTRTAIRYVLAALLALNWMAWMLLLAIRGWLDTGNELPLNLCDWATAATIITLLYPNQHSFELAYFWALGGTLQALLTPNCVYDFPDAQFILFFVYHGAIIAAVLYFVPGLHMRPIPLSLTRVAAWSLVYMATAGAADALLGTNYGFLRAKPAQHTLLDYLSPWPLYLPELVCVGIVFMFVSYAPFFAADLLSGNLRLRTARRG